MLRFWSFGIRRYEKKRRVPRTQRQRHIRQDPNRQKKDSMKLQTSHLVGQIFIDLIRTCQKPIGPRQNPSQCLPFLKNKMYKNRRSRESDTTKCVHYKPFNPLVLFLSILFLLRNGYKITGLCTFYLNCDNKQKPRYNRRGKM